MDDSREGGGSERLEHVLEQKSAFGFKFFNL